MNEIAASYGVHPNQVLPWKKQALEALPAVFSTRRGRVVRDEEARQARLYQQIGQLKVELDWLKKNYRCKTHSSQRFLRKQTPSGRPAG